MTQAAEKSKSLVVAVIGVVLGGLALLWKPEYLFVGYLQAFGFVWSITVGCVGLMVLHGLVGGEWGWKLAPYFKAAIRALPWVAVLFIPVVIGLEQIYPWARAEVVKESPLIQTKTGWLNTPFFLGRSVFYFVAWLWMGFWAERNLPSESPSQGRCGFFTLLMVLTLSFASFDWFMSTQPEWYSSIYGGIFLIGAVISALTFTVILAHSVKDTISVDVWHDFGKLMLMGVMVWAYFNFSQYLLIWSGQLPEEMVWYHSRMTGGWQWIGIVMLAGMFFIPFLLLLARTRKRRPDALVKIALFVLGMRVIDLFWYVAPAYRPSAWVLPVGEIGAYLAVGGIWWFLYNRSLEVPAVVTSKPKPKYEDRNEPRDRH